MKIDFILPWVNGNDVAWQAERNRYSDNPSEIDESRYRDWDILKYWFRAVEKYAPWVNNVHFVTCGQCPQWLNREHPKLRLVDHKDFIPEKYLPTFNSMTIGLNVHRISDLAEHFVYFNDDIYLNRSVSPEDFFQDGLPRDAAIMTSLIPGTALDPHIHTICNVVAVINSYFSKQAVLKQFPSKWYSFKYGKGLLKNILNTPGSHFSCFSNPHVCISCVKTTFQKMWSLESDLLDSACRNKFRSLNGMNQYLMRYWNLCSGNFIPRSPSFGICYNIGTKDGSMYQDIRTGQHKVICVNDNALVTDFEGTKEKLIAAFDAVLPDKCSFEK